MSANIWRDEQIAEWIVIITIFLFASWPQEMVYLSETSLGKLFFVFVVAYFAMIDVSYGMLACGLIIIYYQLDLKRSYASLYRDTLLNESMMEMQDSIVQNSIGNNQIAYQDVKGAIEAYAAGNSDVYSYDPCDPDQGTLFEKNVEKCRRKNELLEYFRKENCSDKGELMYKGAKVRPEMADHVFREIQFANDSAKCNPCDKSCRFSIVADRIAKEDSLIRPKDSKDELVDWNQVINHYLVKPVESIVGDIQHFGNRLNGFISSYSS